MRAQWKKEEIVVHSILIIYNDEIINSRIFFWIGEKEILFSGI